MGAHVGTLKPRALEQGSAVTGYRSSSIDELPTLWDGFAKLVRTGLAIYEAPEWSSGEGCPS